jgi:hypothetical protein
MDTVLHWKFSSIVQISENEIKVNTKSLLWWNITRCRTLMQIKCIPEQKDIGKLLLEIAPKEIERERRKLMTFSSIQNFLCRSTFKRIFKDLLNWPKWKRPQTQWNPISLHKIIINAAQWILFRDRSFLRKNRFYVLIGINDLSSAFHCALHLMKQIQIHVMMLLCNVRRAIVIWIFNFLWFCGWSIVNGDDKFNCEGLQYCREMKLAVGVKFG